MSKIKKKPGRLSSFVKMFIRKETEFPAALKGKNSAFIPTMKPESQVNLRRNEASTIKKDRTKINQGRLNLVNKNAAPSSAQIAQKSNISKLTNLPTKPATASKKKSLTSHAQFSRAHPAPALKEDRLTLRQDKRIGA